MGEKIEIYYNTMKNCYSIRSKDSDRKEHYGKIVAHSLFLQMTDVHFSLHHSKKVDRVVLRGKYAGYLPIDVPPEYEVAFDKGENAFIHATEGKVRRAGYVTVFNDRIGAEQVG